MHRRRVVCVAVHASPQQYHRGPLRKPNALPGKGHAHRAAAAGHVPRRRAAWRAASAATCAKTACCRSAALTASLPPDACRGLVAAAPQVSMRTPA